MTWVRKEGVVRVAAFGQDLTLARALTDILRRPSNGEEVGDKILRRKWRKGEQDWKKRKSCEAASNTEISPLHPDINVSRVPALSYVSLL